ncbi:MAG: type I-U CRISPR-associated RAMP protein Csb1/Cas7u [Acidimicrobiaceae bacterium]|nr:type I-U CRISPR-associated RAMP protein Csb1/Cas7u [Acidimicrobiaceae bacterium]MDE0496430.1 type I-U CRISPR-associated RAMP protein Csb1/Cas7u [Acidimicrobiaceae bacterium]
MAEPLDFERLLQGCRDESFDDGLLIETELVPVAGIGAPVKPAVYEGGRYQRDRRWASPEDAEPQDVIVVDNVPSQANRLEEQLRRARERCGLPEIVLDLSDMDWMPAHLPRQLSSFQFPHRNADAYLRDALLDGQPFDKTDLGQAIFGATPWEAGALVSWFPQALLYGFWQSHLGKKRQQTKHARAWISEIVGWQPGPGADETTRSLGLKGDPLNLSIDETALFDAKDQAGWRLGEKPEKGEDKKKLSELGHGQVPFMSDGDAAPAGVSFRRLTQKVSLSFAQLRRVYMGIGSHQADAAARALIVSIGIHAHVMAFGRGFALRSGAELRPMDVSATWLSSTGDSSVGLGSSESTEELVMLAKDAARAASVPLDGWDQEPLRLQAKDALRKAIQATWPNLDA